MKSNKYEDQSIEEIEKQLAEEKNSLNQIESILNRESNKFTNTKINELHNKAKELKNIIAFHEEVKKFKIQTSPFIFNTNPLTESHKGKICTCYFEDEKKWFTAIINEIFTDTAEITWLGYK